MKKAITVIEITETHLKILRFPDASMHSAVVESCVERIQDPSDQGLAGLLGSIAMAGMKKSSIVLILPRKQIMVRYLSLPSHHHEEITKMISLQIIGQIPYSKEDIIFDHVVLSKNSSGYSTVLVVVVHRDVVHRYLKIFSQARLHIDKIQISSDAIARWFYFHHQTVQPEKTIALLNIDTCSSEICLCREKKSFFSRYIRFGAQDVGADHEDDFVREIINTLEASQRNEIVSWPDKLLILFSSESAKNLAEKIRRNLQLEVQVVNPYALSTIAKKIPEPNIAQGDYYSLMALLGGCSRTEDPTLCLFPPDLEQKKIRRQRKLAWIKVVMFLALNLIMITGLLFGRVHRQKKYYENLKAQRQELKPRVDNILQKQGYLEAIEQHLDLRPLMVDVIYELYQVTPDDVSFRLIHITSAGVVTLQGIAQSLSNVNSFQGQLVHSKTFQDVNLQYATQRRVFQGEITDFRIIAQIVRP